MSKLPRSPSQVRRSTRVRRNPVRGPVSVAIPNPPPNRPPLPIIVHKPIDASTLPGSLDGSNAASSNNGDPAQPERYYLPLRDSIDIYIWYRRNYSITGIRPSPRVINGWYSYTHGGAKLPTPVIMSIIRDGHKNPGADKQVRVGMNQVARIRDWCLVTRRDTGSWPTENQVMNWTEELGLEVKAESDIRDVLAGLKEDEVEEKEGDGAEYDYDFGNEEGMKGVSESTCRQQRYTVGSSHELVAAAEERKRSSDNEPFKATTTSILSMPAAKCQEHERRIRETIFVAAPNGHDATEPEAENEPREKRESRKTRRATKLAVSTGSAASLTPSSSRSETGKKVQGGGRSCEIPRVHRPAYTKEWPNGRYAAVGKGLDSGKTPARSGPLTDAEIDYSVESATKIYYGYWENQLNLYQRSAKPFCFDGQLDLGSKRLNIRVGELFQAATADSQTHAMPEPPERWIRFYFPRRAGVERLPREKKKGLYLPSGNGHQPPKDGLGLQSLHIEPGNPFVVDDDGNVKLGPVLTSHVLGKTGVQGLALTSEKDTDHSKSDKSGSGSSVNLASREVNQDLLKRGTKRKRGHSPIGRSGILTRAQKAALKKEDPKAVAAILTLPHQMGLSIAVTPGEPFSAMQVCRSTSSLSSICNPSIPGDRDQSVEDFLADTIVVRSLSEAASHVITRTPAAIQRNDKGAKRKGKPQRKGKEEILSSVTLRETKPASLPSQSRRQSGGNGGERSTGGEQFRATAPIKPFGRVTGMLAPPVSQSIAVVEGTSRADGHVLKINREAKAGKVNQRVARAETPGQVGIGHGDSHEPTAWVEVENNEQCHTAFGAVNGQVTGDEGSIKTEGYDQFTTARNSFDAEEENIERGQRAEYVGILLHNVSTDSVTREHNQIRGKNKKKKERADRGNPATGITTPPSVMSPATLLPVTDMKVVANRLRCGTDDTIDDDTYLKHVCDDDPEHEATLMDAGTATVNETALTSGNRTLVANDNPRHSGNNGNYARRASATSGLKKECDLEAESCASPTYHTSSTPASEFNGHTRSSSSTNNPIHRTGATYPMRLEYSLKPEAASAKTRLSASTYSNLSATKLWMKPSQTIKEEDLLVPVAPTPLVNSSGNPRIVSVTQPITPTVIDPLSAEIGIPLSPGTAAKIKAYVDSRVKSQLQPAPSIVQQCIHNLCQPIEPIKEYIDERVKLAIESSLQGVNRVSEPMDVVKDEEGVVSRKMKRVEKEDQTTTKEAKNSIASIAEDPVFHLLPLGPTTEHCTSGASNVIVVKEDPDFKIVRSTTLKKETKFDIKPGPSTSSLVDEAQFQPMHNENLKHCLQHARPQGSLDRSTLPHLANFKIANDEELELAVGSSLFTALTGVNPTNRQLKKEPAANRDPPISINNYNIARKGRASKAAYMKKESGIVLTRERREEPERKLVTRGERGKMDKELKRWWDEASVSQRITDRALMRRLEALASGKSIPVSWLNLWKRKHKIVTAPEPQGYMPEDAITLSDDEESTTTSTFIDLDLEKATGV